MRRRTTISLAVGGLVVVLTGTAALVGRDALAARDHLTSAEAQLDAFREAVVAGDVSKAMSSAEAASVDAALALDATDGPHWTVARRVPRFGATASSVRLAAELGAATSDLAISVSADAETLLGAGAETFIVDGRVRTAELRALAVSLGELPTTPIIEARDALAALPASGLVGPASAGRDRAVAAADLAVGTIERTRSGLEAFASFLGADGPRTYLLAVQNPGELRGTGGLISYLAHLSVTDGRISLGDVNDEVNDALDPLVRTTEIANSPSRLEPVERSAEFAARYDSNAGGGLIQSVNLDPDLPTVGPVLLRLYAARGGQPLDGVIMVDPLALGDIVAATGGPMTVEDALRAGAPGIPAALTRENLAQTLLITTYEAFGGLNPARRDFDEAVTLGVLERVISGAWEPLALTTAMADAAAERHLQLFSLDDGEQAAFERLGIAGQLPTFDDRDLLAVTAVNAAPNKADVHVAHRYTGTVALSIPMAGAATSVDRETSLRVEVDNPLRPGDHDTYIVGSTASVPIGSGAQERVDDALNRTWFSVWTPASTQLGALRDPVSGRSLRTGDIHGHRVFDFFLETTSASTNAFELTTRGRAPLGRDGDDRVYTLRLWRQAKGIPDLWDLTVTAPAGWEIVSASVQGGGEPQGLGPGWSADDTAAVEVVDARSARLTGALTRDADLVVRLRPL